MVDLYENVFKLLERYDVEGGGFSKDSEDILGYIRAYTGLDEDQARRIIELFFKEIQNAMLRGDEVFISGLGKFHAVNPAKARKNKDDYTVYPKFKASATLNKRINGK